MTESERQTAVELRLANIDLTTVAFRLGLTGPGKEPVNFCLFKKQVMAEVSEETIDQFEAESLVYEAELAANAYKETRVSLYASLEEQNDMRYWDEINGTTVWRDHITMVKDSVPKPE